MRARSLALALATGLSLLTSMASVSPARADVLSPPPVDCPAGSVGRSGRAHGYCAPTRCGEAGQECPTEPFCPVQSWPCPRPEPWHCEDTPRGLCVQTSVTHGSRPGPGGPVPWSEEITQVRGACVADADCPEGAHCEIARRCAHGESAATTSTPEPTSAPTPVAETPTNGPSTSGARTNGAVGTTEAEPHGLCSAEASRSSRNGPGWGAHAVLVAFGVVTARTRRRPRHVRESDRAVKAR